MDIISKWEEAKLNKLHDKEMRNLGFQDIADTRWLYFRNNISEAFSFVVIINRENYKKNKVKILDRETRTVFSVKNIRETSYKNNQEVLNFLDEIYLDFYNSGLIK